MNTILGKIEEFFNPTLTEVESKVTTFRSVLQAKISAAETEFVSIETTYKKLTNTIETAKADLSALESEFSVVLDKDVIEVEAFFNRLSSHFHAESAPATPASVAVAQAQDPATPVDAPITGTEGTNGVTTLDPRA